mmetsp:Transcript_30462/g.65890  ORF Transcript_30462/g.65890 Transcript_30462/m.65890 type:complete len:452 (+) Transcript_30462:310-1665(+)
MVLHRGDVPLPDVGEPTCREQRDEHSDNGGDGGHGKGPGDDDCGERCDKTAQPDSTGRRRGEEPHGRHGDTTCKDGDVSVTPPSAPCDGTRCVGEGGCAPAVELHVVPARDEGEERTSRPDRGHPEASSHGPSDLERQPWRDGEGRRDHGYGKGGGHSQRAHHNRRSPTAGRANGADSGRVGEGGRVEGEPELDKARGQRGTTSIGVGVGVVVAVRVQRPTTQRRERAGHTGGMGAETAAVECRGGTGAMQERSCLVFPDRELVGGSRAVEERRQRHTRDREAEGRLDGEVPDKRAKRDQGDGGGDGERDGAGPVERRRNDNGTARGDDDTRDNDEPDDNPHEVTHKAEAVARGGVGLGGDEGAWEVEEQRCEHHAGHGGHDTAGHGRGEGGGRGRGGAWGKLHGVECAVADCRVLCLVGHRCLCPELVVGVVRHGVVVAQRGAERRGDTG